MAHYKVYKLVESTSEALQYYYIPQHCVFIPKCPNAQHVLLTLLCERRDVHHPTHVSEYPIISREHSLLFGGIPKLTVRVHYNKYISNDDIRKMEADKERARLQQLLDTCDIDIDIL